MRNIKNKLIAILFTPAFLLLTGCAMDEPAGPSTRITFRLTTQNAMDGRLTIDEAYLKLGSVEIEGSASGGNSTHIVQGIPPGDPPFELAGANSSAIDLPIPPGLYSQLVFGLLLASDGYSPVTEDPTPQEAPASPGDDNAEPSDNGQTDEPASDSDPGDGQDQNGDENSGVDDTGGDDDHAGETPQDDHDEDDGEDEGDTGNEPQHDDHEKGDKGNHDKNKDKGKHKKDDKGHNGKDDGKITDSEAAAVIDLDDFFRNARPGLLVIGTYQNNGKSVRLIFVGNGIERLAVPARQNDSPEIILTGNGNAEITFDPERWFSSVTPADLEAGSVQQYQGQPVIFIHPDFNSGLFQAVMPHIQESADLNFAGSAF